MHKIKVVDEYREWVVREMCQIVVDEAQSALCRAPCACCGHPIGRIQPLRLVALLRGGVRFCHQGCVARLLALGARELAHGECLEDSKRRGDCRKYFRRLLLSIGGLEMPAGNAADEGQREASSTSKFLNNGDASRVARGTETAVPQKRKEPVRRRTSLGRRVKRVMVRAKR